MKFNQEILDAVFKCPKCKSERKLTITGDVIFCSECSQEYKIIDGVPCLFVKENLPDNFDKQTAFFNAESIKRSHGESFKIDAWQRKYIEVFEDYSGVSCAHEFVSSSDVPPFEGYLLDNGCGSGYMTVGLAGKYKMVVSCDLTLSNLLILERNLEKSNLDNVILCCCSSDNLPLKSGIFDDCCMNAVLEHIPNEKSAISELSRVLKPDGKQMLVLPLMYRYLNPLLLLPNIFHDKMIGHLRRYDEKSIYNKFKFSFNIEKIFYTGHTKKAFKILMNSALNVSFDWDKVEEEDMRKQNVKRYASNIACLLKRKLEGKI